MNVRVDPTPGAAADAHAMSFGVYPGASVGVKVSEVADGQYHLLEVPGVYHHDPGKTLYFAPPKSHTIEAMYVDRIVAVRQK